MRRTLSLIAVAAIAGLLPAQSPLTTTFASNNGQSGNMFDLVALTPVTITGFDVNIDAGTWNLEIYTKAGPYLPDVFNAAAWGAPIATYTGVAGAGLNLVTSLPQNIAVPIGAGSTQSFYVTVTNGTSMNYTNGLAGTTGTVFAANSDLQFLAGAGMAYPFLSNFNPRIFNGNIYYAGGAAPSFQTNSAGASLDVNGVQSSGFTAAVSNVCAGATNTGTVTGGTGAVAYDIAYTIATTVLPNNFITGAGQIVNLDFLSPTFGFVFGSLVPFAGFSVPIVLGPGTPEIDAQMVVVDFSAAEGFFLSQAVCIQTSTGGGVIAGPTTDDSSVSIDMTALPVCSQPISLFGTSYNVAHLSSNGRILGVGPDTSFTPTLAAALAGNPFVGFWMDFNPAVGGNISLDLNTPGEARFIWNNVPQFGGTAAAGISLEAYYRFSDCSWCVRIGLGLSNATNNMFLGLSPGNLGPATDPGPQNFMPGLAGAALSPTDMCYDLAPGNAQPIFATGGTGVLFTPDGLGNYVWTGM